MDATMATQPQLNATTSLNTSVKHGDEQEVDKEMEDEYKCKEERHRTEEGKHETKEGRYKSKDVRNTKPATQGIALGQRDAEE
jgi:hypothetical protein